MPVVGFGGEPKQRRRRRVVDAHHGDLDAEEAGVVTRDLIQEIERLAVFFSELGRHPHHGRGVGACRRR